MKIVKLTPTKEAKCLWIKHKGKMHLIVFSSEIDHSIMIRKIKKHLKKYDEIKPGFLIENLAILYSEQVEEIFLKEGGNGE